jgi:hypothetical protein
MNPKVNSEISFEIQSKNKSNYGQFSAWS